MEDTIASISTSLGVGAISIIRVSGTQAIKIVNNIFKGKDLNKVSSHTIHYGKIIDKTKEIDEVLVSVMKTPKTYTTEDIVEINCHGGIITTNKVLELLIKNGCRLAEPGEFTKRAFLNGRIDLIEADGIMNLIESKSELSRKLSYNQLSGKVTNKIDELRNILIQIISNIEVNIDYPEYEDVENITNEKILKELLNIKEKLIEMINSSEDGKIINQGIKIGIIGRPNVGKSSLLNCLLEEEKAIVTNIEGTTRDIVEGDIQINGISVHLIDTAGIRKTNNLVEQIGVNKSKEIIKNSNLILLILNNNEKLTKDDIDLINLVKNKKHIILINKIDLKTKIDKLEDENIIQLSIKENIGIKELKEKIIRLFNLEEIQKDDLNYITNARSIGLLKKSLDIINKIIDNISNNVDTILIEIDLKQVWNLLGEIIGKTYQEEMLDEMFKRFCLGK